MLLILVLITDGHELVYFCDDAARGGQAAARGGRGERGNGDRFFLWRKEAVRTGIFRYFCLFVEYINDFVYILLSQAVFIAVFYKATACMGFTKAPYIYNFFCNIFISFVFFAPFAVDSWGLRCAMG